MKTSFLTDVKARKSLKGQGLVLMAFFTVILVGFAALAVDYSMLALEAASMQKAADSAALAGAAKLELSNSSGTLTATSASKTSAKGDAVFIAGQNGYTISAADVTFPVEYRVRVGVAVNSPLFLAKIWRASSASVNRHATAEASSIGAIGGVAPLGITTSDYIKYGPGGPNDGQEFTVNLVVNQNDNFEQGNALALSTDGNPSKSVAEFKDQLSSAQHTSYAEVGQVLNSLNGSQSVQNAAKAALEDRLSSGNVRFPISIIPPKAQTNGTSYHVGDLAFVELTNVRNATGGQGSNSSGIRISFRFVEMNNVNLSQYDVKLAPAGTTGSSLTILRLVDDL